MSYEIKYSGEVTGLDLDDRRREIKHLLVGHDCEITFTKVNGEIRTMPCTLREAALPPMSVTESKKKQNDAVMSVWCLDKNMWRSFKIANVTEIRIIEKCP